MSEMIIYTLVQQLSQLFLEALEFFPLVLFVLNNNLEICFPLLFLWKVLGYCSEMHREEQVNRVKKALLVPKRLFSLVIKKSTLQPTFHFDLLVKSHLINVFTAFECSALNIVLFVLKQKINSSNDTGTALVRI